MLQIKFLQYKGRGIATGKASTEISRVYFVQLQQISAIVGDNFGSFLTINYVWPLHPSSRVVSGGPRLARFACLSASVFSAPGCFLQFVFVSAVGGTTCFSGFLARAEKDEARK
jgi:hypothetical protein